MVADILRNVAKITTNDRRYKPTSHTDDKISKSDTTAMHSSSSQMMEDTSSGRLRRPSPARRRITIGGSKPQTANDERKPRSFLSHAMSTDMIRSGSVTFSRSSRRSEVGEEFGFHQKTLSESRSTNRLYPPTSWKSTSTIRSYTSDSDDPSTSQTDEEGSVYSGSSGLQTITGGEKVSEKVPDIPDAEKPRPVRRRYSIISRRPSSSDLEVPSEANRAASLPTIDNFDTRNPALPGPEMAYAHIFHYTACPHMSPPKSRPLNVQPIPVQYVARRPPRLQGFQTNPALTSPSIYVLEGMCVDCDLSARRQAESDVLDKYSHTLENLSIQLSFLQKDIATENPESVQGIQISDNAITSLTFPSTLSLASEVTQGILDIEEQLDKLIRQRDQEVKQVWRGYTARWGPGTVRIHRDEGNVGDTNQEPNASSPSIVGGNSTSSSTSIDSRLRTPERPSTNASATSMPTNRAGRSFLSPQSSFTTRTRASSVGGVRDRYSDGTYEVSVESSVDGIKKDGRMVVDWIRPAREEKQRGMESKATSRSGSRRRR